MAHDVFISYAIEDQLTAEKVCEALEGNGIRCWRAPRDVPFGVDYEEAIVDAISDSRLVVLILSSHSNNSPHVKREIQNACAGEDVSIPILPVRVENITLNKALRYYLSSAQWLDASTPPIESHLQRLVEQLRTRLQIAAPAEPANATHAVVRDAPAPPLPTPATTHEPAHDSAHESVPDSTPELTAEPPHAPEPVSARETAPAPPTAVSANNAVATTDTVAPPVVEEEPAGETESVHAPEPASPVVVTPTETVATTDTAEPPPTGEKPVAVVHPAPSEDYDGPHLTFLSDASPSGAGRFKWMSGALTRTLLVVASSFVILGVGMVAVYQSFPAPYYVRRYVMTSVGVSLGFLLVEGLVTYFCIKRFRPSWRVLCGIIGVALIGVIVGWYNFHVRDGFARIYVTAKSGGEPVAVVELRDANGVLKGREEVGASVSWVDFYNLDPGDYTLSVTPRTGLGLASNTTPLRVDRKNIEKYIQLEVSAPAK